MGWELGVGLVSATAACVAAVVATLTWVHARSSSAKTSQQNEELLSSSARVEAALEREEARSTERNDVDWSVDLKGSVWLLTNTGTDPALDVLADITFDDSSDRVEVEEIAGGRSVQLDLPIPPPPQEGISWAQVPSSLWKRIVWRTPAGRWHVRDEGGFFSP